MSAQTQLIASPEERGPAPAAARDFKSFAAEIVRMTNPGSTEDPATLIERVHEKAVLQLLEIGRKR